MFLNGQETMRYLRDIKLEWDYPMLEKNLVNSLGMTQKEHGQFIMILTMLPKVIG